MLLTAPALGQGAPSPQAVVEVAAAGDPAVTTSMAERVRALGTRLGVSTHWQTRSGIDARDVLSDKHVDAGILARVWLDLSDPKRAVLYVANATHDRFLVRVVPANGGYGELTQESLTTIVESVIDALVAGGQIGVDRAEATRKIEEDVGVRVEPPPPATLAPTLAGPAAAAAPLRDEGATASPPPRRPGVVVDAAYRVDVVANGPSIRQGPQVALSFTRHLTPGVDLLVWFGGHYAAPSTVGDASEQVRLHGGGGRAAAGVTGRAGAAFSWRAALGGGVDAFDVRANVAPQSGWVATDGYAIAVPIVTTFLGGSIHASRWLEIPFSFGLDVDPSSHHFDAQSGSERTVLARPWVAHPFGTIGIGVPVAP
jgi:hypothetical protein